MEGFGTSEGDPLFQVIQDPKCLNGVLADLRANRFKDVQAVYDDLNLIFLNALHYNREDSQIAKDANTLKVRSERFGEAINRD